LTLATLLVPPSLDARQALRLRRLGLAALTYALTLALVAIAWSFDVLPGRVALQIAAMYLHLARRNARVRMLPYIPDGKLFVA
jgi:hypothetical protein